MAYYDEVIERNKRYLTNAQVNALVAASQEYNIQNAGNRAGALASAREQYDTGYRGLQNMGLAGAMSGAPTSGEVPRLQTQIQAPFDAYNNRLRQVENQRLNAMGGMMAEQTRQARAAAARQAAIDQLRAAEDEIVNRVKATKQQAAIDQLRAAENDIVNRVKATKQQAAVDAAKRTAALKQAQTQQAAQVRDFRAASNPEVTTQEQMAVRAAAEVLGVGNKNTTTQSTGFFKKNGTVKQTETKQTTPQNTEEQKAEDTRQSFVLNPVKIDRTTMQGLAGTPAQRQQRIVYTQSANVLNTGKGYDTDADQQALAEAQNTLDNMKWRQHYGGKVDPTDYKNAQDQVEILKLKVEHPDLYAALVVYNNEDARNTPEYDKAADVIAKEEAKALVKQVYGRDIDTSMTFDEYENAGKNLKEIKTLVARLDYAEKTLDVAKKNKMLPETIAEDQALVDSTIADIENLGYTVDQARNLATNYAQERDVRTELEYYTNAFKADMLYSGKMPIHDINDEETDVTYRAVNNLPDLMREKNNWWDYLPGSMANSALTDQAMSLGGVWGQWMTQDQKNAYNYLYDTKGIKAANEYLDSIRPLINIQHAQEDAEYAKELVNDSVGSAILANLGSIPIRAAGSIPAALEKLVVGGLNAASDLVTGGTGSKYYIDTNSPANQLANYASTIRSETSQRILEENQDNPTLANWANRAYQIGMSTADSAFNMAYGVAGAPWMTGMLAGSDAANEAYKDARARGGTQEQALAVAGLSGIAENLFERISLEYFTNQWIEKGAAWTRPFIVKWGLGAGVEGSEEVATSIANLLSDVYVMHDKSEWQNLVDEKGIKGAVLDEIKSIGWEGLAGAISGGVFGLFGGAFNAATNYADTTNIGKKAESLGLVQKYEDMATVLGGKAEKSAAKAELKPTAHNVGSMVNQVNKLLSETFTGNEQNDIPMALLFSGKQLSFTEANDVYQALGSEKLENMGYESDSVRSFMESYNKRMADAGIFARMQAQLKESQKNTPSAEAEEYPTMTDQLGGTEYNEKNIAQNKAMREALEKRVWKNPNVGTVTTDDGTEVAAMPGNLTAVSIAEQQRTNFKANATATSGRVTYAVAGMQAREGMTNEQTLDEIKKGLTKEARAKADFYEKLSKALGLKMTIHDVMVGTNGFIDENGNMHVVLSGKQSVLRVAAHELTHFMKENASGHYAEMRDFLIAEVGKDRFDRMIKQKAREYGIDLSTEKGKTIADDEVCAELCERMLSDTDAIERFAEKNTAAAKTLKDHLLKILNAIKAALKDAKNRDFGESWSDMVKGQETIEKWITGLDAAIENAEKNAQVKQTTREQTVSKAEADELYRSAEDIRAEEAKKAAEESAQKKTYVPGFKAAEVERVLDAGVFGDKSNYEGDDYEQARGMIAQLIPDMVSLLKKEGDIDAVVEKTKAVVGKMLDNYFEDDGDMAALREAIPSVIGVDSTAKTDLKAQDQSLFQMSAKLSKALGHQVTLVSEQNAKGQKNAKYSSAEKLEEVWERVRDQFGLSDDQDFSIDTTKLLDFIEQHADTRKTFDDLYGKQRQEIITSTAVDILQAVKDMYSEKTGQRFSLDTDSLRSQKEYEQKRDELYSSLTSAKDKLRKAEAKRKEVLESKEYNDAVEAVTKAKGDELDAAIKKYVAFMNESGANGAQREIDALKKDVERLSKEFDDLVSGKQQSDRVRAIEKSGLSEQDYDRKQAGKEFGYTPYFYDAGYMLPDGKLLNFSGEKGRHFGTRGQDHRAIGTIYEDSEGSEAMIRFMNGGNIRVMAETPGIDISNVTEPTREQYAKIRSFAQESAGKRFFNVDISDENGNSVGALTYDGRVSPDKVVNDIKHYFETGEIRQQSDMSRFLYSLDTDAAREAFTKIDTEALDKGLESLKNVTPGKGLWAIKDISRFLDSVSGGDKELRDTLTKIFETPHRQALKNYATGVGEMQKRVLDIGEKAGVCDSKGHHFDKKKSAAIQNIGEGFSNRHTDVTVRIVDADAVQVKATDKETGKDLGTKDYTFRELRGAYGREVADQLWSDAFDAAQDAGKPVDVEREVNTQPYTLDDLKAAYPQDWQKLKAAADEFRTMYDDYIRNINGMLETIYPYASKYADVDKITEAIEKKQQRLADKKAAYNVQIENLQKSLEEKEREMASKKRTDTKAYRQLVDQANQIMTKIADTQAEIAEYEANVKDELAVMGEEKALMQNAEREGDSLGRMHRLEYRSDYFHHFTEMASGVQNLKSIFTGNTDISPAVVGKSDQTKPKSRFAGFFQQRKGGDYTADALNGMLRYGQLAEYKLAFDPFAAYLRNVEKQVANLDKNETNRDNLIRYIQQWTNTILGKSHTIDRALVDSGIGMRSKMFKAINWINSRVIQNTLLWNMRSALIQISNVTNAKGIVTNNLDWANGLRKWALAARGNTEMQSIMNQSTFLASRYMDNLQLTDSVFKSAKKFAGWLLGALDEVSAKATWWAAYEQYQRNPNAKVIQNAYRSYDNAIDYADDVTRRTHAGRGVGELAPAMTSRVINLVAPFQVEVNNTYQLLKDNVKQKNYLGLLSTGLSVFALNTIFEAIVGSTPLGFDIIRAIVDIAFGIAGDDPGDDDDDYGVGRAVQRLAGEFVGGLPYANQIVGLIGKDNAEKIIGSDTDVTRYGNTQIGLNAMMNTVAGVSDLFNAAKDGKNLFTETNFISDIDDLLNIIMPMGAKQLTRTAEGLMTMAKGYGGKADKQGNEKVQFVADNDLVNWLHAGLFGKWALTQASEYFDEERLLPKLFGAYEGPKSATGQLVDAKEYKAALETGIDGKQYFTLKYDLKGITTQGGKRAELMQQDFTPEQKAQLDALLVPSKDAEMKTEGAVVYQKIGDDWKVKADYTNQDMFDLSQAGDKVYTGTLEAIDKTGLPQDQAVLAASMWDQAKEADDSKTEFRNLLRDNQNLTVAQKEALDLQYCGNKYPADYSDPDLYELSLDSNRSTYEKAKQAKSQGVSVKTFTGLNDKKKAYEGDGQATYMRGEIMKTNLSVKQKEMLDDLLVSDKGSNPDYSSQAWFDVSMLGNGQYQEAKEGAKIGLTPETYLSVYNKWKTIDAKNENGKTVNGLKKKRAKEYLDSLTISAPVYDYIWTVVFGYKK